MIGARIVHALAIGDQHSKQRAQFQELMPIVVVARQPRGIQAQHQPRLPEANLGDQPLEAAAAVARRTGLPEKSRDAVLARAGYSSDRFGTCCSG